MGQSGINGSCHCGAVKFTYRGQTERLVSCNCSICRRYRSLWAHTERSNLEFHEKGEMVEYLWGDREIIFHSCATCGCTTHWSSANTESHDRVAANVAMADPQDIAHIKVWHFDGADTWEFVD